MGKKEQNKMTSAFEDIKAGLMEAIAHADGKAPQIKAHRSRPVDVKAVIARIDDSIKQEASVLASMGLTVSDAMRMMLTRVAREQALPFEPLVPNAATIKAMKDARSGKTKKHATLESLMAVLNADD
jgi:DNA-damage-inducible protein J